jgi:hypothetical protein
MDRSLPDEWSYLMTGSSSERDFIPTYPEAEDGPGVQGDNPPGVPAGSAKPEGGTEFVSGAEVSDTEEADTGALESPVAPSGHPEDSPGR